MFKFIAAIIAAVIIGNQFGSGMGWAAFLAMFAVSAESPNEKE